MNNAHYEQKHIGNEMTFMLAVNFVHYERLERLLFVKLELQRGKVSTIRNIVQRSNPTAE